MNYRATLAVNGVKKPKLPKPYVIPRPGSKVKSATTKQPVRPKATKDQIAALLAMSHKPVTEG